MIVSYVENNTNVHLSMVDEHEKDVSCFKGLHTLRMLKNEIYEKLET